MIEKERVGWSPHGVQSPAVKEAFVLGVVNLVSPSGFHPGKETRPAQLSSARWSRQSSGTVVTSDVRVCVCVYSEICVGGVSTGGRTRVTNVTATAQQTRHNKVCLILSQDKHTTFKHIRAHTHKSVSPGIKEIVCTMYRPRSLPEVLPDPCPCMGALRSPLSLSKPHSLT